MAKLEITNQQMNTICEDPYNGLDTYLCIGDGPLYKIPVKKTPTGWLLCDDGFIEELDRVKYNELKQIVDTNI